MTAGPLIDNPPWLARTVTANMKLIADSVPAEWHPQIGKLKATGRGNKIAGEIVQYGCGAYGCVMPTDDPGVVFKVTEDTTEVEFVRTVLPKVAPAGVTAYYATLDLRPDKSRKRPVFGLWREAADGIGAVTPESTQLLRAAHDISDTIYATLMGAHDPYMLYLAARTRDRRLGREAADLAENFTDLRNAWRAMADDPELQHVGAALLAFLDAGVLVADIHEGNVGHVTRDDADYVVITDPGHTAVLPEPWR